MYQIPLTSVPNQSISFSVDGAFWTIHLYQSILHMCADITVNGTVIATAVRCFGGIALMQYPYMYQPNFGNFIFDTDGDWTNFDSSCNLYYLESAEYAQYQALAAQGML
jgi:hypothetical protein